MDRSKVTGGFVAAATAFVRQAHRGGRPVCGNVLPDDVQSTFFPSKGLRGGGSKRARHLGVIGAIDDQIGPLFDLICGDPDLRSNTLVVVASDNGQLYESALDADERVNSAADRTDVVGAPTRAVLDWYPAPPVTVHRPANPEVDPPYRKRDDG